MPSFGDLDAWRVHADELLEKGDPFGELLAIDLALPAVPTDEQLDAFKAVTRHLRRDRLPAIGWCLGHVRVLAVRGEQMNRWRLEEGEVAAAKQIAREPRSRFLEALEIHIEGDQTFGGSWSSLFWGLPECCTRLRVVVHNEAPDPQLAGRLFLWVRDRIRSIEVDLGRYSRPARDTIGTFIDDRFDEVVLRPHLDESAWQGVLDGLARTERVRVRVTNANRRDAPPRVVFGVDGDCALVGPAGELRSLRRPDLFELQRRYGIVSARAQLERCLSERYAEGLILRHPDGRWTYRPEGGLPSPLPEGVPVLLNGTTWRFLGERDVDARYRSLNR